MPTTFYVFGEDTSSSFNAPLRAAIRSRSTVSEGPGFKSYDLSLAKHFKMTERFDLRLKADFFNIFNNVNFNSVSVVQTSGGFGTISSAHPSRNIQLGLKLAF